VKRAARPWISRRKSAAANRPSPSALGERVRRRGQAHADLDEPAQQRRDEDGVAGVVELELVDGEQPVVRQLLDGPGEPERAHEVGQLHEGAERPRLRRGVPERGQQVRLAHPEAAVQVHAGRPGRRALAAEQPAAPRPGRRPQARREALQQLQRARLRGLCRVGPVGLEAHVGELRWRHEPGDQGVGRHRGRPVDQAQHGHDRRA